MKKYPPSPQKATAQTVASNNIIAYGIFRFHEGMSICRFHELRHSFASYYLMNGGNIITLKNMLGHAHLNTTNIYLHIALNFNELEGIKYV